MSCRIHGPEPTQHPEQRFAGIEAMQGGEAGGGFLAGGEGALPQRVLFHDCEPIGLGRSIRSNRRQQGLQLLEHQGLAGMRAAVGNPEAQRGQVALGAGDLRGLGFGAAGGHAAEGLGCPGRALVEAAPRLSAHAAQLGSRSSLPAGNACRRLASQSVVSHAKSMQLPHFFGLHLWGGLTALWAHAGRSQRAGCSSSMQPQRLRVLRPDPQP